LSALLTLSSPSVAEGPGAEWLDELTPAEAELIGLWIEQGGNF
jgi:hypothetical protein